MLVGVFQTHKEEGFLEAHVGYGKAWECEPACVNNWSSPGAGFTVYVIGSSLFSPLISLCSFAMMTLLD